MLIFLLSLFIFFNPIWLASLPGMFALSCIFLPGFFFATSWKLCYLILLSYSESSYTWFFCPNYWVSLPNFSSLFTDFFYLFFLLYPVSSFTWFFCPILWARAWACRSFWGFQSLSKIMTVSAVAKLTPRPPARVDKRKQKSSDPSALKWSMACLRRSPLTDPSNLCQ